MNPTNPINSTNSINSMNSINPQTQKLFSRFSLYHLSRGFPDLYTWLVLVLMEAQGPLLYILAEKSYSMRCFGAMLMILGLMSVDVKGAWAKGRGFTQEDRERLIRLETTLQVFMEQVDKGFEAVDRGFEELPEDMNKGFEQLMAFLWMLVAIFASLTGVIVGFAYWDRRTIIRKAKEEAVEAIEKKV